MNLPVATAGAAGVESQGTPSLVEARSVIGDTLTQQYSLSPHAAPGRVPTKDSPCCLAGNHACYCGGPGKVENTMESQPGVQWADNPCLLLSPGRSMWPQEALWSQRAEALYFPVHKGVGEFLLQFLLKNRNS